MKNENKGIRIKERFKANNKLEVSPLRRLFAYLIDHAILVLLYAIPIKYIYSVITQKIETKITLDMFDLPYALMVFAICLLISFYYLIYLPVYKYPGKTIGKRVLGLKVVKRNGNDLDLKTMIIREGIGVVLLEGATYPISGYLYSLLGMLIKSNIEKTLVYIFSAITIISIVYAFINRDNAMLHDSIAKTKVISTKE